MAAHSKSKTAPPAKPLIAEGEQGPAAAVKSDAYGLTAEQFQAISRALAEPRRFEMLQQIASCGALMCGALHAQDCLSPATISHHLKELQEAGLIEAERNGRQMNLRLRRPVWAAYLAELQQL